MEEISRLLIQAQDGDKKAREVLIEKNLGLIHHIVKRFSGRGYELEDLFQIGSIGLMKAIDHFDLSYQVRFSTYAVPMIQGEIKRFLRDDGMVKVSRTLKENGWKISIAQAEFNRSNGNDPTLSELCEKTGLSLEEIVTAMDANSEIESIYRNLYQADGNEILLADKLKEPRDAHEEAVNRIFVHQLMEKLNMEEKRLIQLRYFCNKTQVEAAGEMGISQVQVSRLEKKILIRFRQELQNSV